MSWIPTILWLQLLAVLFVSSNLSNTQKSTSIGLPSHIRIQVNNESIQNAPYLLETLKQVEGGGSSIRQNSSVDSTGAASEIPNAAPNVAASESNLFQAQTPKLSNPDQVDLDESPSEDLVGHKELSGIEEASDAEPELPLKPDGTPPVSGGTNLVAPDYSKISDLAIAETSPASVPTSSSGQQQVAGSAGGDESAMSSKEEFSSLPKTERKPQLPVTTSHLKRPALAQEDEDQIGASAARNESTGGIIHGSGGAKSLVSPTVSVDELKPSGAPIKKIPIHIPDLLEPSQIMQGVTNVSTVPAIVNREYGHHTRTRITLGGGYVRDKQPPLVNPASSGYSDDKPEKPLTPLERPNKQRESASTEVSRVIEVPERIVLPTSVFTQSEQNQHQSSSNKQSTNVTSSSLQDGQPPGKLDPRCPKRGIKTIEHATACDKYYYCEDGYISEMICPNGLMYGIRDLLVDYCVHRWKADCQDKSMPNPVSSPGCRWQYGIFSVQGSPKCSPDFYECTAGKFEVKKCSVDGQVYDDRTKSCMFAEQVGCANELLADFHCPPDDQTNTYWPFPRYFLNERALIHCINDKPEIVRCTENERVDPEHLHCIPQIKIGALAGVLSDERKSRQKKNPK